MQQHTRKRPEPELQLWEINAPGSMQASDTKRHNRTNHRKTYVRREQYRPTQARRNIKTADAKTAYNTGNHRPSRPVQSIKRRRAKRRRVLFYRCLALAIFTLFLIGVFKLTGLVYQGVRAWRQSGELTALWQDMNEDTPMENSIDKPTITVNLLEPNRYSRPGTSLKNVKNIFVHYTANKGTSAEQNRSYFANLAETGERSASAHFIIGYNGEIIQCIPLEEEAYAVKGRNNDSVSIECCYLSEDGSFTSSTYNSLVELLSWLCGEYGLTEQDILRHYDAGGKKCPLYYVDHEDEWKQLREDVARFMDDAANG